MRLRNLLPAAAAAFVVSLGPATAGHAHEGHGQPGEGRSVRFDLHELNGSGAHATASVTVGADGGLTVDIVGEGFVPGLPHAQHIHGAPEVHTHFCPNAAVDENGDGQIATEEAEWQFGAATVALTTGGDTSAASGLDLERMPVADAQGRIEYHRTIPADQLPEGLAAHVENLHIVQHGIDVNGNGTYDFTSLGPSLYARSLGLEGVPEEATNPATCGEVMPMGAVETGGGAGSGSGTALGLGVACLVGAAGALLLRYRLGGGPGRP